MIQNLFAKKYIVIFCFFLISSCVDRNYDQEIVSDVVSEQEVFPFTTDPLPVALMKAFTNALPDNILLEYDAVLQSVLEEEFDGKKIKFYTKDKTLKVEFNLRESFKIVEKNLYCREYSQHVEFMSEIIDNIGVACRKGNKVWENLVLLTQ